MAQIGKPIYKRAKDTMLALEMSNGNRFKIWIDTGGTFTDCIGINPQGEMLRCKVLSSSALRGTVINRKGDRSFIVEQKWNAVKDFVKGFEFRILGGKMSVRVESFCNDESLLTLEEPLCEEAQPGTTFEVISPEEAPVLAARLLTGRTLAEKLPDIEMRLATTKGTNALLTRNGARTALFITKGFADLLTIGTQQRPDLFALNITKPQPLYEEVVEAPERLDSNGVVLTPLDVPALRNKARELLSKGIRGAAVALMHSYVNPIHEEMLGRILIEEGFEYIALSSGLAPFIKILPRAETAVVDAYLGPVISKYLNRVAHPAAGGTLHVMTSAGGLVGITKYRAKDSLLSGPAGGVVGSAISGKHSGFKRVIAFDMGGTSTDVSRYDGKYEYHFEHVVGDAHLVAPALAIESVAAGGGSICHLDGNLLQAGPQSASALPGPACYNAGGPLTLTDVNLLLGRLDESRFEIPVSCEPAKEELEKICAKLDSDSGERVDRQAILEGFIHIADEKMADAIRSISLRKGYDPADYALLAFGGAGPQHACGVADKLGVSTIIIPTDPGLLSAIGIGNAVIERFAARQVLARLKSYNGLEGLIDELKNEAIAAVMDEGVKREHIEVRRVIVNMRFWGQETALSVEYDGHTPLSELFADSYYRSYGHWPEGRDIEVESVQVAASSTAEILSPSPATVREQTGKSECKTLAVFDGVEMPTQHFERSELEPGRCVYGPALVFERHSTIVIAPGYKAETDGAGAIILTRTVAESAINQSKKPEAVNLELFTNRFRAVVAEMGEVLRATALSTNVKERMDFSCALLNPKGELVVNAPHIPVHLGAMGLCVRAVMQEIKLEPGDVVITNHPAYGGSHLPDVTVITPVFTENGDLLGFVANRAHHAEIGGISPGSMPANAANLAQEGVAIRPAYLVKNGKPQITKIMKLLSQSPYPSRAVDDNLADIRAAIAANNRGAQSLIAMAEKFGADRVHHYMNALNDYAEQRARAAISALGDGVYEAEEFLDDGSPLRVKITVSNGGALIDFTGTAPVHKGNLNATPAVVNSVVLYVIRLLVQGPLPLNEGISRTVKVILPRCMLNPDFNAEAENCPAVFSGNVETSQRLVDTLIKAFGISACSQGTMNNVVFGNGSVSYYETVCGGCGAGVDFDGADAVHSHMTNTRITDAEIIERRYPVILEEFSIRRGSGGMGKHNGGDGVRRVFRFLDELGLSVSAQHRTTGPFGINGGEPGQTGRHYVVRANGEVVELNSVDFCMVFAGDSFVLHTPGGGGFGLPQGFDC